MSGILGYLVFFAVVVGVFFFANFLKDGAKTIVFPSRPAAFRVGGYKFGLTCVALFVVLVVFMMCLVDHHVPMRKALGVLYFGLYYLFGKMAFARFSHSTPFSLAFATLLTMIWHMFPNDIVMTTLAAVAAVTILALFRDVFSLRNMLLFLVVVMVYDVFAVFAVNSMEDLASAVSAAPSMIQTSTDFALGMPDIVVPGFLVMIAFREAEKRALPLLVWGTIAGYVVGMLVGLAALNSFNCGQPATLYLIPGVAAGFFLTARAYRIPFRTLL